MMQPRAVLNSQRHDRVWWGRWMQIGTPKKLDFRGELAQARLERCFQSFSYLAFATNPCVVVLRSVLLKTQHDLLLKI